MQLGVVARRDVAVPAREPSRGRLGHLLARRHERVEPREQALALGLRRRVAEPLVRQEGGDRQRLVVAQGEVGQAREPGLEPVHHVVAALRQSEREIGADSDRDAHAAAPRDRDRRAERDRLRLGAVLERVAPGRQLAGARRRREHRHPVPAGAEAAGDTRDMLVDIVGLRPVEGRDQADLQHIESSPGMP